MSTASILVPARKVTLEIASGRRRGELFSFSKTVITIGRGAENDVVLENDIKVSRNHVEIRQEHNGLTIKNMTDKNSLLLNGQEIKFATIEMESRFLIGNTEFILRGEDLAEAPPAPAPDHSPVPINSLVIKKSASSGIVKSTGFSPYPYLPGGGSTSAQPAAAAAAAPGFVKPPSKGGNRIGFYLIFALVILGGAWLITSGLKKKIPQEIRSTEEMEKDVETSVDASTEIQKRLDKEGKGTIQYDMAQQQYIKGFRDYRQGQYARALQSLRAAMAIFPQHELARRYLTLAQKKLDEEVKEEMDLGRKYRGQGNFRMCYASFRKVIMMVADDSDSNVKEAAQYMQECDLQQRERY